MLKTHMRGVNIMNKQRRKQLEKAVLHLNDALEIVRNALEEEQGAYDNMPDGIRDGERGEEMQGYVDTLEEHANTIEEAVSAIEEIVG